MRASVAIPVLAALCAGCAARPAVPPLPEPGEVEKVTVTVFGSLSDQPDLAEYPVPPAFVPDVLRVLSPAEYHARPPAKPADVVGVVRIARTDGRTHEVRLIYSRGETVLLTIDGVPCRRTGSYADMDPATGVHRPEVLGIEAFLRAVHQGNAGKVRAALARLDRSAGR